LLRKIKHRESKTTRKKKVPLLAELYKCCEAKSEFLEAKAKRHKEAEVEGDQAASYVSDGKLFKFKI